ncbi:tetratricopeptide repeat-containing sensor histidine kinase [Flavobacterium algicola]|uniref:tetratricopeptide repeat-containing sensor histidine kinase n=1 Tax=Flavobacterium algicola TaxID=556529 RepID=UPI001EFE8BB4|nr:tetratricopeptide repeat-containing sensor histidine kinase [Flavobacterium algicola]MCG9792027.1 tetratricopeptide repeat-containing sensor histidine kinase [Flavobacterium algicola]
MKSIILNLICFCFLQAALGQKIVTATFASDTLLIHSHINKALSYSSKEQLASENLFNEALSIANSIKSEEQIAKVYYNKAMYNYNNYDNFESIKNLNKALPIFEKNQDIKNLSTTNYLLAESYLSAGSDDIAFKYFIRALRLYQEDGNQTKVAYCYNGIGAIYSNKNHIVALKYIKKTFPIFMKNRDYNGLALSYINIANTTNNQGNYKQAIAFYFKAITALKNVDNAFNLAICYNNIGDCYNKLKKYDIALNYFTKALTVAEELETPYFSALVFHNIAESKFYQGLYDEVIMYGNSSVELAKQCSDLEIETESLLLISNAYEQKGNKTAALQFKNEFISIKERTFKESDKKKIQLFQSILEVEKSQLQIDELEVLNENNLLKLQSKMNWTYFLIFILLLLALFIIVLKFQQSAKKRINNLLLIKTEEIGTMKDKIQVQNDYLNDLNTTKNKLFKIIAHDLKNPLSSIEGFTDLMIHDDDDYDRYERKEYLKIIKDSANKASMILNDVLFWAVNQEKPMNNKKLVISKLIKDELKLLEIQALQKEIAIENKVDKDLELFTDKNKFDTIIRNLISNAIKFTPEKGKISIYSELKNNIVKITVKDNGTGIPENEKANLFVVNYKKSKLGTNSEEGTGLGLVLCKDFVEKLGGQITVISNLNSGSEFSFTLPYITEEVTEKSLINEEELV